MCSPVFFLKLINDCGCVDLEQNVLHGFVGYSFDFSYLLSLSFISFKNSKSWSMHIWIESRRITRRKLRLQKVWIYVEEFEKKSVNLRKKVWIWEKKFVKLSADRNWSRCVFETSMCVRVQIIVFQNYWKFQFKNIFDHYYNKILNISFHDFEKDEVSCCAISLWVFFTFFITNFSVFD